MEKVIDYLTIKWFDFLWYVGKLMPDDNNDQSDD
jgi:hypothetical protein